MGVVLAVGLLVSAGIDLLVARRLDRRLGGAGAAGALQFAGSVVCAVAFASVFAGFWLPQELRFGYALLAGLAFRIAYAFYDLPQNALMALATADPAARDRVAATRIWFSGVATLLVAGAVGPLIAGRDEAAAWLYLSLAVAIGVPAVISAGLLARIVRQAGPGTVRLRQTTPSARGGGAPRGFWLLIFLMFVTSLATPLFAKVEPFFAVYVLASPVWGGLIVVAMALGVTVGQPVWNRLARRVSRTRVLWVAAMLQVGSLALFWALPPDAPGGLGLAAFGFGIGNGGVGMALWGGFSEVVARSTRQGGAGAAYGAFTATAKIALAIGGLGLGAALETMGYRQGQTMGLVVLMTVVPGLGALACIVIAAAWRRSDLRSVSAGIEEAKA